MGSIEQLAGRLKNEFEDIHLEDGVNHPAEAIIDEALLSMDRRLVLARFRALAVNAAEPDLASSVLRCLGRRHLGTAAWRAGVVKDALAANDIEIRDAAVQAAESWGGPEVREVLQGHEESVPWLRTYIEDVVEDLGA